MIISTEGDIGDIVYLCAVIKEIPDGPHVLTVTASQWTKAKTEGDADNLVLAVKELVESQPYITEVRRTMAGENVWWDSSGFRKRPFSWKTLVGAHSSYLQEIRGIGGDVSGSDKWLTVTPSVESVGRVVINRTGRYRNTMFPWAEIVKAYKHTLLFVGMEHEWREFCGHFGHVEFRPTGNLLQVAELIAGSELFIGNQSCAFAIAEGLKHQAIQETSLNVPDCIFNRPNVQHVINGMCVLPSVDNIPETIVKGATVKVSDVDTKTVPPGIIVNGKREHQGWVVKFRDGSIERSNFIEALVSMARQRGMTRDEVIQQNIDRNPEYFFNATYGSIISGARMVIERSK